MFSIRPYLLHRPLSDSDRQTEQEGKEVSLVPCGNKSEGDQEQRAEKQKQTRDFTAPAET